MSYEIVHWAGSTAGTLVTDVASVDYGRVPGYFAVQQFNNLYSTSPDIVVLTDEVLKQICEERGFKCVEA